MKSLLIASLALVLSAQAQAATLRIDCQSDSDPDQTTISIYQQDNGKLFGVIEEFYGDGDGYAEDVIEMKEVGSGDAQTFIQVPGKYPKSSLAKKATNKTQGAVLRVAFEKDKQSASTITGLSAPSGNELADDGLNCKRVSKIEHKR